jgi:hypothetical protein
MIPHTRTAKRSGTAQLEGGKKKPGELYGTSLNGQQQPRKHFGILLVSSSSSLSDFFSKLENVNYDADLSQPKDLYFVFFIFFYRMVGGTR